MNLDRLSLTSNAARDAFDERIAILMEGPGEPELVAQEIAFEEALAFQKRMDDRKPKPQTQLALFNIGAPKEQYAAPR